MGVFKRYKNAQAAQKDAENAMPGAYQSNYTDRINEALDSMGAASNAGYDVGTDSELYRQYRAGAQANARAAAENAAAGAAALSGGYGSSYANSVAQQGYQQAMANVDSGLAGLRDKALTMYQLKQNGLSGLLSALQNQDSLEAAEHQGAVANAQDWRDYKKSRADQAAQEKSDFLSNLWEMAKSVGRAGLTAYDTYKGYTQQQWENEFAREQWEYNKERTGQSDALNAYEQAFNLYQQGAGDAANAVLGRYGLDTGIFDNYSGAPITRADKAGALTTAAGLAGGGSDEAARAVLELYGLDPNSVGNYRTIAGRQLATALAKKSAGSSGGSSGSRSSGGTEGSGDSWTNSQLQSIAKTFSSMKGNEPLYDFYKRTLTDAGWIKDDTPNLLETDRGLTGQSWKGDPANKWGTGTSNRQSQSTGRTASQSSVPQRAQVAANAIKGQRNHGSDDQTIFDSLKYQGYTDDEIWKAFELAG
ncbi:MAG: hypothetical protein OGM65_01615 [Faecalibacterium prausnitzii]|jgi:hypothetical protein|nr:MAG: hypothetical protein [Bacteriophage sp.]UWI06665.1 MAG: hypothetical protein [Bacteriophage sp.]UYJ01760.1 MAG: hypothetical protein OGM65_01615 [Faecalibacterium prausnitzii]